MSVRSVVVVAAGLALAIPRAARAQCEANASSCVDCHEVRGLRPVLDDDRPWHRDHGFGDLCAGCHGGDPADVSQDGAHAARRDPRDACVDCHPDDHEARALGYVPAAAPSPPARPRVAPPAPGSTATAVVAGAAVLLGGVIAWQLARGRARPRRSVVAWLRARRWSPYAAGVGLGVVVAIAEAGLGRALSASSAFDKLAAYPGSALFPEAPYYAHVMSPGITWPVWLMIGVLAGAFASSRLAREARLRWLPDALWVPRFGRSRARRLAIAFVGAALVQLGAGIAGGCTSGLALSGGALLAPAAFLFMAGMFAGGMPTAWLLYRRRGGR